MTDTGGRPESRVRESTLQDRDAIFRLREAVYGIPFDEAEWHWKFEQHSGHPAKVFVAESEGSIVGLRPFIVERLKVLNCSWLTGLGVDIMVHPDYRRHGIASQVANEAAALMDAAGIPILTGFPNEAAFKVYVRRRSNWRHICSIPMMVKLLSFNAIVGKYLKPPALRWPLAMVASLLWGLLFRDRTRAHPDVSVSAVEDFDERFDALWEDVSQLHPIALVRDREFLRWRFVEKPDGADTIYIAERDRTLVGYVALRTAEMFGLRAGFILDMLAVDDDASETLVSKAVGHFRGLAVEAAGCLMLRHTPYFKAFRKAGFVVAPKRAIHKEFYFGATVNSPDLPDEVVNRRENWYLTFADLDREVPT